MSAPWEYKVVAQKQRGLMGRFDHTDLEVLLNEWAEDGWELDRIVDPAVTALLEGERAVHVLVFRRPA